jgi:uncharacterized protein YdhG (YjbR/CyaY superfamily)
VSHAVPKSVDDYIALQPQSAQAALRDVRTAVLHALPGAEERISYSMPTYTLNGLPVLYFAAWKRHYSLYPASARLLSHFAGDLASCTINKSTIRFPLSEPVPRGLIRRIAEFRLLELRERPNTRAAKSK